MIRSTVTGAPAALALALSLALVADQVAGQQPRIDAPAASIEALDREFDALRERLALDWSVTAKRQDLLRTLQADTTHAGRVRLVAAWQMLERADDLHAALTALAVRPGRWQVWAKARLAGLEARRQGRTAAVSDYLERAVADLDTERAGKVRGLLQGLGALAVPAILARLPQFSPIGMRNGIDLVLPHVDAAVLKTLRGMLQADDGIVQTVAAGALNRLRGPDRVELARIALDCRAEPARLAAVQALLGAAVDRDRCLAELDKLRRSNSSTVREEAVRLLSHRGLDGVDRVDGWLEELILDRASSSSRIAIDVWLNRVDPADTQRRVDMFRRVGPELTAQMIRSECGRPEAQRAYDILFEGLRDLGLAPRVASRLPDSEVVRDVPRLVEMLRTAPRSLEIGGVRHDGIHRDGQALSPVEFLLAVLQVRPTPGTQEALRELLTSAEMSVRSMQMSVRSRAFDAMARIDPVWLLDEHDRFDELLVGVAREHARPADLKWVVRTRWPTREIVEIAQRHSDASTFGALLELVRIPGQRCSVAQITTLHEIIKGWSGAQHVVPALHRLFEVDSWMASKLLELIETHARPEDAVEVIGVLRATATRRGGVFPTFGSPEPIQLSVVRSSLINTLGRLGGPATPYLVGLLDDPASSAPVMRSLERAKDFEPRPVYLRILREPKPAHWRSDGELSTLNRILGDKRTAADADLRAAALACIRAWPEGRGGLRVDILRAVSPTEAKATATALLQRIGTKASVDRDTAAATLQVVGELRDEAMIPALACGLQHPDTGVRLAAVVGLGRTLSRQAAPNLITALGDDSDSVRKAAEYHLGTIASILEKKRRFAGQFGLEEGKDK